MVTEWKELLWDVREERAALWGHCQALFTRHSYPPLRVSTPFLSSSIGDVGCKFGSLVCKFGLVHKFDHKRMSHFISKKSHVRSSLYLAHQGSKAGKEGLCLAGWHVFPEACGCSGG